MKAFVTDIVRFTFFSTMVAVFAVVGVVAARVIGFVPRRTRHPA